MLGNRIYAWKKKVHDSFSSLNVGYYLFVAFYHLCLGTCPLSQC